MFVHWGFSCLVQKDVILLPQFLNFSLEHSVCVNQSIVSVFGFVDGHLKLLLNLLVGTHLLLHSGILRLFLLLFFIFIIFFLLGIFLILLFVVLVFRNLLLAFVLFIVHRFQDHVGKFRVLVVLIFDQLVVVIYVTFVGVRNEQRSKAHLQVLKISSVFVFIFTWLAICNWVWAFSDVKFDPSSLFPVQI